MYSSWASMVARLAAALGAAAILGLLYGGLAWWLLAALGGAVAYLVWQVYLLERWLKTGKRRRTAPPAGVWSSIYAEIIALKQRARRRKKRFHRLVREVRASTNAMHDGGVILNQDGEIVWLNEAARSLLGLDPARDIGQRITNLVRRPDFTAYFDSGEYGEPLTLPLPKRDGWVSVQVIPYGNEQKLLIAQDITRQIRLENTRRDFVANASHELRSPLTVIAGYLEGMTDDEALETWQGPVREMQRQARRMNAIVNDLITLTRLESAEELAGRELIDVCAMLSLMHKEVMSRSERPERVELALETDAGLLGEEGEVHSIFSNLINNALRFTPRSGSVVCRWREDGDGSVAFEVRDTGIGIPDDMIPRVTERFFRVDSGRAREVGGTGLGLAIVKHALARHEGTLEVDSTLGEGSVFTCHFPAKRVARRGGHKRAS